MSVDKIVMQNLEKSLLWIKKGEKGDPNGAYHYQARKSLEDAINSLKRKKD